jgi:hypothetical protein
VWLGTAIETLEREMLKGCASERMWWFIRSTNGFSPHNVVLRVRDVVVKIGSVG